MAACAVLSIRVLHRGGALSAISRTLMAEVWRRGILPVGGAILYVGIGILPFVLSESLDSESRLISLLEYGQAWTTATLLLLSLLMSCGSFCDEVLTGRIRWLVVRPGTTWALLPGKFLGVILALLVMLLPAFLFLLLLVGSSSDPPVLIQNPDAVVVVVPETLQVTDQEVETYLALQMLEDPQGWGLLAEEQGRQRARAQIERLARSISVGNSHDYWFQFPAGLVKGSVLSIRPSLGRVHRSERARLRVQFEDEMTEVVIRNGERSTITLPESMNGSREFRIGLQFLGAVDDEIRIPSVLWSGNDAIELRVPDGTLVSALVKSQMLALVRCAFVAVLGLTASTFLGMPVATLFVLCFLVAAAGGGFTGAFETKETPVFADPRGQEPSRVLIDALAEGGDFIVRQLSDWNQYSTGARVAAGENVSLAEVIGGFATIGLLWGGLIMLLGIYICSRQEHGLGRDR